MTQSPAHIIYVLINHNLTGLIVHTENCIGKSVYTDTRYKHIIWIRFMRVFNYNNSSSAAVINSSIKEIILAIGIV